MTPEEIIKDHFSKLGKKGGKRTKELHPNHHREAGLKGLAKRWKKKREEQNGLHT